MIDKIVFIAVLCIGMVAMKESTTLWEELSMQNTVDEPSLEITPDSCIILIVEEDCIEE